jgi:glycosyltransferase involved in cell wall biosynthesis
MRVLFFNEGNLGTHILGQGQLDAALRAGLASAPVLEAHFAGLSPLAGVANAAATRPVRSLAALDLGLRTFRWHLVQSLRARRQLGRALEDWPADVVQVHSQAVALLIGPVIGAAPVVLSVDATIADWSAMPAWSSGRGHPEIALSPSRALERRALRRAPLVLAWTGWARRAVERDAPGANVIEHHAGLDLERYRPAARAERQHARVLFIGGRFLEKGGQDLLRALDGRLGLDVELDLVTPAPVPERPGVRVHRLRPGDPGLLELQQQADVMCLPTYGDTNPWAILESMACGTPVISTPVGAIPEMLADGEAGVLVPYGEPRALREALDGLLGDATRRTGLAARARERCERRYDARRQLPILAEHLRQVSEAQRPPIASGS